MTDKEFVQRLNDICKEQGWSIAIPKGKVFNGFVIGTEDYCERVVRKVGWSLFEAIITPPKDDGPQSA